MDKVFKPSVKQRQNEVALVDNAENLHQFYPKIKMGNQSLILIPPDHNNINLNCGAEAGT